MLQRVKRWVLVSLLAVSIGTPWALLQSVAWFGMVVSYSKQAGLAQAISMTFDGKHPCRLCKLVQDGQTRERQSGEKSFAPEKQLDQSLPPSTFQLLHPPVPAPPVATDLAPSAHVEAPRPPPPRLI